jgi:hypothetical protein
MSEVTPKTDLICEAGALVEFAGEWLVVASIAPNGRRTTMTTGEAFDSKAFRVLLPRRPADPAEVLRCLAALPGAEQCPRWPEMRRILLGWCQRAPIEIRWYGDDWAKFEEYPPYLSAITVDDPDILDKASNRLRALRSWLAQPAKEVAE